MEGDEDYYDESAVNCQPDLIYYTKAYEYIYIITLPEFTAGICILYVVVLEQENVYCSAK